MGWGVLAKAAAPKKVYAGMKSGIVAPKEYAVKPSPRPAGIGRFGLGKNRLGR